MVKIAGAGGFWRRAGVEIISNLARLRRFFFFRFAALVQAKSITQYFAGIDDGNRLEAERRALLRETREIDAMIV